MDTATHKKGPWDSAPDLTTLTGAEVHRLYRDEQLDGLQAKRAGALQWRGRRPLLMIAGGLLGLGIASFYPDLIVALIAAIIGAALGAWVPSLIAQSSRGETHQALAACIASALKLSAESSQQTPPVVERANNLNLLPSYDRSNFSSAYQGAFEGIEFDICRAHLEREETNTSVSSDGKVTTRTEWVTAFNGIILNFDLQRKFEAPIRLRRNRLLGKLFDRDNRINYVHPDFNDRFTVYCDDPMTAKYIIHPNMVETLISLDQEFSEEGFFGDFINGSMLAIIPEFTPFDYADIDPATDIACLDAFLLDWRKIHHFINSISEKD
jgi:Protein of unknown function (DUF3137)